MIWHRLSEKIPGEVGGPRLLPNGELGVALDGFQKDSLEGLLPVFAPRVLEMPEVMPAHTELSQVFANPALHVYSGANVVAPGVQVAKSVDAGAGCIRSKEGNAI